MSKFVTAILNPTESETWDSFVHKNTYSIFHNWFWLKTIESESKFELIPLVTYKGEHLVSIFPLFKRSYFGLKVLLSPPPKFAVPNLGPIFETLTKQVSAENQNHKIIESQIQFLKNYIKYDYLNFLNIVENKDIRPYLWKGYTENVLYTYFIDLDQNPEQLFNNLDGHIRTSVRKVMKENNFEIIENSKGLFFEIIKMVRERYTEQGLSYDLSDSYLNSLYKQYGNNNIKSIGIKKDGEIITGLILIESYGYVGHWIGGINNKNVPMNGLNELLHWETMRKYSELGFNYYELVGGNTRHLTTYKSRYNGNPRLYFELEDSNIIGKIGNYLYKKLL